jgi:hypothetical protein
MDLCRPLALGLALLLPVAHAAPPPPASQSQPALPQEQPLLRAPVQRLSLDQAVAKVRSEHPQVEVVGASTRERSSGAVHEVKVLTAKGKLRVIRYDASSGRRLN